MRTNLDNNYLTSSSSSSSSQSTLIIRTDATTAPTQVNNDFCNTCNEISATDNNSYHNITKRYDNKFYSSIGNIIKSERFDTDRATVNNGYLNLILCELFKAIGATGNVKYLNLIEVELFSTNGETTKTSYDGVNEEERYNSNGETANNSGDFFDDFLNSRWCDGQRTITPRGGVKHNCASAQPDWLKCIQKKRMHKQAATQHNDNNGGYHDRHDYDNQRPCMDR